MEMMGLLTIGILSLALLFGAGYFFETLNQQKSLIEALRTDAESLSKRARLAESYVDDRVDALYEYVMELENRVSKLEAKNKSAGKELIKRAKKAKKGNSIVNVQLAPRIKSPKEMVFNLAKPKKQASK